MKVQFLSVAGIQLKSFAPFTASDAVMARLTAAAADLLTVAGITFLPVRLSLSVKGMSYPSTNPWVIFQINMIMYLSRLRS